MKIEEIMPDYIYINNEKELNFYAKQLKINDLKLNKWFDIKSNLSELKGNKQEQFYIAKPLDSYESIAKKLNIDVNLLKQINNNEPIFIGKKIHINLYKK